MKRKRKRKKKKNGTAARKHDRYSSLLAGGRKARPIIKRRKIMGEKTEGAWKAEEGFVSIQQLFDGGWDYTLYTPEYELIDGGQIDDEESSIIEIRDQILEDFGWSREGITEVDYDELEEAVGY